MSELIEIEQWDGKENLETFAPRGVDSLVNTLEPLTCNERVMHVQCAYRTLRNAVANLKGYEDRDLIHELVMAELNHILRLPRPTIFKA